MLGKSAKWLAVATLISTGVFSHLSIAAPPKPAVKVDQVKEMVLPASTDLMGTIYSRSYTQITAGVSGRLDWLAEPGTLVQQGDVLVRMDLLPLELEKAEQKAQLTRSEINTRYYQNELKRLTKLRDTNSASQFQLDQTRSQFELSQADEEISRIKLQQIDDRIERATVKAPFDGVVTERLVRAGTDINRSDVLLKLLDTEHLEVRLFVPVKYLAYVQKGKTLTLSALDQQISATVSAVIPSADARSQTFEVRIQIPVELNERWTAGQLIKVTVPVQSATPSLTVSRDALILRKEGTYVVKIADDNKVHRLPVTVGKGTVERVSVTGELTDGDRVAIRGAERLREGQEVVIQ